MLTFFRTKNIIRIVLVLLMIIVFVTVYKNCQSKDISMSIEEQSSLIEKQLKNVSKLVVTEGTYSQVYNYKDQKKYFFDTFSFNKKALMVVNAEVSVQYDLKKLDYKIDADNKKVIILSIPQEEIKINPSIKFHDIEDSFFNPFKGEDYNKISEKVTNDLKQKIANSKMVKNAQNRLLSELSSLFIVSNSLEWQIEYNNQIIEQENQLLIPIQN